MSEKFVVEIISPVKSLIKTNASEVIIPSYEGEMGILKDHIPLITFLRPGIVRIISENEKVSELVQFLSESNLVSKWKSLPSSLMLPDTCIIKMYK